MHEHGYGVCLSFSELEPPVEFIDESIPFNTFLFDPARITVSSLYRLSRNIKKYNIKYVYLTDQRSIWWFYLFLRTIGIKKIIVHSRVSVSSPLPAPPETGLNKIIKSLLGSMPSITPDRIYAVSNFVKNRLIKKNCLPVTKVTTIYNGINIDKFKCGNTVSTNEKITIFSGARATKHKGIMTLIDAANIILNEYKQDNFIINYAGDGPDIDKFHKKVENFGLDEHFIFLGELRQTHDQLCKADIVVVPSEWGDAFPSAVSEALAAGKPLITTRAGGIPEIVGNDSNAIIIPPSDKTSLAKELSILINDKDKRIYLSKNARKRAEEELNEKRYYQQVIDQLSTDLF
jgi:glycosyltransferase involved in cell wall biosynthesis